MTWLTVTSPSGGASVSTSTFGTPVANNLTIIGAAWTAYAPVLTAATTNPTAYTTSGSAWMQAGKLTFVRVVVTMAATVGTGAYSVTLPAAPRNAGLFLIQGTLFDTSAGSTYPAFMLVGSGSATCGIYVMPTVAGNPLAAATAAVPVVPGAGDVWTFNGVYEAA